MNGKRVLVTGSAGFIGFHVTSTLLQQGATVLGVDNFSEYYDTGLKESRNDILSNDPNFSPARISIEDIDALGDAWQAFKPDIVIHLAAQAGVRYSIEAPASYVAANLVGTFNILELARHHPVEHLLCASTSSVYGANKEMPYAETQRTALPVSLYAATKGANELMAHSYAHLFKTPITMFRFFTVYGPWGRPDMAPTKFAKAIFAGTPIDVYNHGDMQRDFTYVGDLAEAVSRLARAIPGGEPVAGDSLSPVAPYRIVNIGQGRPTKLMDFIAALESAAGKPALKNFLPMQKGDVHATEASSALLEALTGYTPSTPPAQGVIEFIRWYRDYYRV